MKGYRLLAPACLLLFLCEAAPARAEIITFEIEALIDGRDLLIIHRDTLQWHHLDFAAVGRFGGRDDPTVISSSLDGVPQMDRFGWIPTWPLPPPDDIRFEAFSSVFQGLMPALPAEDVMVTLTPLRARSVLRILELPSALNDYTLVLDFDDNGPLGPDLYIARVTIETAEVVTAIPEPGAAALALVGAVAMLGCGWRRWMKSKASKDLP